MMRLITNISTCLAATLTAILLPGCIADHFPDDQEDVRGPGTIGISVGFEGSTRSGNGGNADYEPGEGLENYLAIEDDGYRIYFFSADAGNDEDNTYIATFTPVVKPTIKEVETVNGVQTYYYYQFRGPMPPAMPVNFKIVTLANWSKYPEETENAVSGDFQLVKGVTRLQDICQHAEARFGRLTPDAGGNWLSTTDNRLIPFYGVREYDLRDYVPESDIETDEDGKEHVRGGVYVDVSRKDGSDTSLPLLRAMAKVEVILDNPYIDFEEVSVNKVNGNGCNAPEKALQHSDYDHGYTWDLDFIRDVHLPDGTNRPGNPEAIRLTREKDADGNATDRWVGYVPEYRNIGVGADFSYISVKMAKPEDISDEDWENIINPKDPETGAPSGNGPDLFRKVYFAPDGSEENNNTDAQAVRDKDGRFSPGRFNIERNNIYRFTLSGMNAIMKVQVDVQPYAECKLDYDLGLMRDERGDMMVVATKDKDGKYTYPEFFTKFMETHEWPKDDKGNELIPQHDFITDASGKELTINDDYYAIVRTPTTDGIKLEVWLKDKDGYRVMSNYGDRHDGQDCSARLVHHYTGQQMDGETYKDRGGDRRVQHNTDHSSLAYNSSDMLIFKSASKSDNPFDVDSYLVESWDNVEKNPDGTSNPEYQNFWYVREQSEVFRSSENEAGLKEVLGKFGMLESDGSIPGQYRYLLDKRQVITEVTDDKGETETIVSYHDRYAMVQSLHKAGISGEDYEGIIQNVAAEYLPEEKSAGNGE